MTIRLIVPTRGRPDAARELSEAFSATAELGTTLLTFAIDDDDPQLPGYLKSIPWGSDSRISHVVGPRLRMGPTLNTEAITAARSSSIVGFCGDDHRPRTRAWDTAVEGALLERPGVAYGDDLIHGPNLPTAAFVSSELIRRLGYMHPPALIHLYLDNFWLHLGTHTHLAYLPDVVFEHLHPIAGKAEWDSGYVEVNASNVQDHDRLEFDRYLQEDWPVDKERLA